jgi:signal transduction histidine kinase
VIAPLVEKSQSSLLLPALCISGVLLAVGVTAAGSLMQSQRQASRLLGLEIDSIRHSEEMATAVREAEILALRNVHKLEPADRQYLDERRRSAGRSLEALRGLFTSREEETLLPRLAAANTQFWSTLSDVLDTPGSDISAILGAADSVVRQIEEYSYVDRNLAHASTVRQRTLFNRLAGFFTVLGLTGSIVSLVIGFVVARSLQRSMIELSVSIQDTAGKLDEVVGPITITSGRASSTSEELVVDLSSRVELVAQKLAQSNREVLRGERLASLGRLAAGLAHELRNPIASMKLLIQSAIERGTAIGDRRLVVLEEEILRLESQIQLFLDFARPPVVEKRLFDLNTTLDQKLLLVSGRAAQKRLHIRREGASQPLSIVADPGQIRQLILNLLLNAIDASPDGGTLLVRACVETSPRSDPHEDESVSTLVLEIGDSGPGIPAEVLERLFEPFFSTKQTGIGLGLPICKQIVEAHQGSIEAGNRPEGGALFRVRLPLGAAVSDALPNRTHAPARA